MDRRNMLTTVASGVATVAATPLTLMASETKQKSLKGFIVCHINVGDTPQHLVKLVMDRTVQQMKEEKEKNPGWKDWNVFVKPVRNQDTEISVHLLDENGNPNEVNGFVDTFRGTFLNIAMPMLGKAIQEKRNMERILNECGFQIIDGDLYRIGPNHSIIIRQC